MSVPIRPFESFDDALQAVTEAGFQLLSHRMRNTAFNPRTCFRHPDTGEVVEVLRNHDRGQVNRLPGPADAVSPIPMEVMP